MNMTSALTLLTQAVDLLRKAGASAHTPHAAQVALVDALPWSNTDKIVWTRALGHIETIQHAVQQVALSSTAMHEKVNDWVVSVNTKKPWYQTQSSWLAKRHEASTELFVSTKKQHDQLKNVVSALTFGLEALKELQEQASAHDTLQQNLAIVALGLASSQERLKTLMIQQESQMQSMVLFQQATHTLNMSTE